jgi:hypothetical protein
MNKDGGFTRRFTSKPFGWRGVFAMALVLGIGWPLGATPAGSDGYERVGFDRLAGFKFVPPAPDLAPDNARQAGESQIPDAIKALNGRKTLVTGYMLPVRLANGRVTEFLLVRDPSMCCYGAVPEMNEWVVVKMKSGGVAPVMDVPVGFYGELKVGPQFENGYMTGIYELAGERMGQVGS